MKFFDFQHPFYKPLWIRIVITALCLGWAVVELLGDNFFWAMLFGSVGLYAAHQFFIAFNPREPGEDDRP
jgi:hypothetical protein